MIGFEHYYDGLTKIFINEQWKRQKETCYIQEKNTNNLHGLVIGYVNKWDEEKTLLIRNYGNYNNDIKL